MRKITGRLYPKLDPILTNIPLQKPDPIDIEEWVLSSVKYNSTLQASHFAVDATKSTINSARGGYLPTIDLVSRYNNRSEFGAGFSGIDTERGSVGVQFNFPVFQSGLVISQVRQAKYNYETSLADLETSYRNATVSTRQFYNNVISGISVVKADRQTVISANKSVESNEAAYQVGTRTIVDVLLVQNRLYDAQRQLAIDQYNYINDILALKNAAGILSTVDLEKINTWLNASKAHTTMERYKKNNASPKHKKT